MGGPINLMLSRLNHDGVGDLIQIQGICLAPSHPLSLPLPHSPAVHLVVLPGFGWGGMDGWMGSTTVSLETLPVAPP